MAGQCCIRGRRSRRLARRLSAAIFPAAALLLLPKCPLCLAAWLTFSTGIAFSAAGAAWVRWTFVVIAVAAAALVAAPAIRRSD
jgi:hypothetical protein